MLAYFLISVFVKNFVVIFIGIALNLQIAFGRMAISTILILHKEGSVCLIVFIFKEQQLKLSKYMEPNDTLM